MSPEILGLLLLGLLFVVILGGFPISFTLLFLAMVFGYIGRKQIDQSGGRETGRGLATAGIVLGWVWAMLIVVYIGFIVIAAASSSNG